MIPGFMGSMYMGSRDPELVLIDRTAGTNIGDMTALGGLAAAFDGVTSQIAAQCASRATSSGWVGKSFAGPRVVGRVITYGSSNAGYQNTAGNVNLTLRAKSGSAPSSVTDGTIIGTTGAFPNSFGTNSKTIDSTDLVTAWDHIWIQQQSTGGANVFMAELGMYAWE